MEKRNIGKSGLSAPFLGLGTWAIGGGSWWGDNDDALSVKAIETAVEQGITWIDTAPIYGLYHSEEVVGEALRHIDRDKVILSTKCGLEWRHESPVLHKVVDGVQTYRDLSAKSIIEDVEDSLRRLGTDHLDLLQLHTPDPETPIAETLGVLNQLVAAGTVRYIGHSNFTADQAVEADAVMALPLAEMKGYFGQWAQGAQAEDDTHTRWPVGGSDFRETMYGLSWIPAGVEYTTDLAEPARGELRETLERMLRALDAPPPGRPPGAGARRQQS